MKNLLETGKIYGVTKPITIDSFEKTSSYDEFITKGVINLKENDFILILSKFVNATVTLFYYSAEHETTIYEAMNLKTGDIFFIATRLCYFFDEEVYVYEKSENFELVNLK